MRVIFLTTVFDDVHNGPGTYARYLWDSFRDDPDIDFHIVVPSSRVKHPNIHESGLVGNSLGLYLAVQKKALNLILEMHFDIVHANISHLVGGLDVDIPMLVQINDYEVVEAFDKPLKTICEKGIKRALSLAWRKHNEYKAINKSVGVICNSYFVKDKIVKGYRIDEKKCITIYKATDLSLFEYSHPPRYRLKNEDKSGLKILFVGSNWHIKGLDLLLEAITKIHADFPGVVLNVVGVEAVTANVKIRASFKFLEEKGVVRYCGRLNKEDIAKMMWDSNIFVLPSRQEALGVSVLEAMAAGVPVIASSAGGLPEILQASKFGLAFEAGNVNSLAGRLVEMLSSVALREKYSLAGGERVLDFSVDKMIRDVKLFYKQFKAAK